MAVQPFLGLGGFFSFSMSVGLLGWGIGPSQGLLYLESGRMRLLERSDRKWENNIKMDLRGIVSVHIDGVSWLRINLERLKI
jgi:hypothetical protein